MNLQRVLLRAMLWMLGLSAAAGVMAVFLSTRVMGRVAGTALIAAIAVALAMPVSKWMDDEKKRMGGLVGLGAIVLAFMLALAAVWAELFTFGWRDPTWRLAGTAILVCIGGMLAAAMVAGRTAAGHRWSRTVALSSDVVAAVFLAAAIWTGYPVSQRLWATGWLAASSGLVAALSLMGLGSDARWWRWLGVGASVIGLILGILGVWFVPSNDPTVYIAAMSVGAAVAYAVVVLGVPMGEARGWACAVSIGSVAATGACLSLLSLMTGGLDHGGPELLTKLTGAMGIVAACSTLGVVILWRLNRRGPEAGALVSEIRSIQIVCPHCGKKEAQPVGESHCAGCGLVFDIRISEPKCGKCDYPLLGLQALVCPECGTSRQAAAPGG